MVAWAKFKKQYGWVGENEHNRAETIASIEPGSLSLQAVPARIKKNDWGELVSGQIERATAAFSLDSTGHLKGNIWCWGEVVPTLTQWP